MKIIGGKFKGKNFYMPAGIRPTQNLARKALFDLLGQDLKGMAFLDLFAGSGAVGLEAISRGAREVVFAEKDPKCVQVIHDNLALFPLRAAGPGACSYEVLESDAFAAVKLLARQAKTFDIVFADPPYRRGLGKKILKTLGGYDIVNPNSTLIIEHEHKETLPSHEGRFLLLGERKYGNAVFSIYKC